MNWSFIVNRLKSLVSSPAGKAIIDSGKRIAEGVAIQLTVGYLKDGISGNQKEKPIGSLDQLRVTLAQTRISSLAATYQTIEAHMARALSYYYLGDYTNFISHLSELYRLGAERLTGSQLPEETVGGDRRLELANLMDSIVPVLKHAGVLR